MHFEHFPTALTEHFPIVHAAKHYFGMPVVADLRVVAQHADLPAHGEGFHGGGTPDDVWDAWLNKYAGHAFDDPRVAVSRAHPERLAPGANAGHVVVTLLTDEQLRAKLSALGLETAGARGALVARLEVALGSDSVGY